MSRNRLEDLWHFHKKQTIDAASHFPSDQLRVITMPQYWFVQDFRHDLPPELNVSPPWKVMVSKLKSYDFFDVYPSKFYAPTLFGSIFKKRHRVRTIDIVPPIPHVVRSLDVRDYRPIPSVWTYPDIYPAPLTLPVEIAKTSSRYAGYFFRFGIITAGILFVVFTSSYAFGKYLEWTVQNAYGSLLLLKWVNNLQEAKWIIEESRTNFQKAYVLAFPFTWTYHKIGIRIAILDKAFWAIEGGKEIADMMLSGYYLYQNFLTQSQQLSKDDIPTMTSSQQATDFLRDQKPFLETFHAHLESALSAYARIDTTGNGENDEKLKKVVAFLSGGETITSFVLKNYESVLYLLGDVRPQRYLILNQNRDEIRASGGFPGSVIELEIYKWSVRKYEKRDIYYYDWHLYPYKENPPEGISKITTNFGLRDANYYPYFSDSIEKMNFFFERSGQWSLDTVIAFNQGLIIDLLRKYGGIKIADVPMEITADNFSSLMSIMVEAKFQKKETPKDILFRFIAAFEKKLVQTGDFPGYIDAVLSHIRSGEILIGSRDPVIQNFIDAQYQSQPWTKDEGNWIYPIFTSISGNKSDRYMDRSFTIDSRIMSECSYLQKFTLVSKHGITADEKQRMEKMMYDLGITEKAEIGRLLEIQGDTPNRQFVRVMLPESVRIITANDSMIVEKTNHGHTSVWFYVDTAPGKESTASFDYESKPKNCDGKPKFYVQPGMGKYSVNIGQ